MWEEEERGKSKMARRGVGEPCCQNGPFFILEMLKGEAGAAARAKSLWMSMDHMPHVCFSRARRKEPVYLCK